jgi:hypothetical protein
MTPQKLLMNQLNPSSLLKRGWVLTLIVVGGLVLCSMAQAIEPAAPDVDRGGGNTSDGAGALAGLTSGTFNSAFGWDSLLVLSDASFNTAVGGGALLIDNGGENTAVGAGALLSNNVAADNNAVGAFALFNNDSDAAGLGEFNNAHGREALVNNVDGEENNAFGDFSLRNNLASHNTAMGDNSLISNTTGDGNTAVGRGAGNLIVDGNDNVCIGHHAGTGLGASVDNCIAIGAPGAGPFATFNNTCFIGSIFDQIVSDPGTQEAVFVDQFNVVGIFSSSRRTKHDIQAMDKTSEMLYRLKPVTFKFNSDWKGTTQYGLIAEEVAEVNPGLVTRRSDGQLSSVHYEQVNMMLLNEFLKEHKKVEDLQATVTQQQKGMEVLTAQLKEQAAQIQKVSAQVQMAKPATKVAAQNP